MEEFAADPLVHADGASDVVHVAPDLVAEVGDLVDERNLHREKRVCGVLREFGCFERSDHEWRFDQIERTIQVFHDRDRFFVAAAENDAIRTHEVVYCGAFAKKLRIRYHAKVRLCFLSRVDQFADVLARADWNGRLGDDHFVIVHVVRNRTRGGFEDRKSTRLNSSHSQISYAVFCLKKKKKEKRPTYFPCILMQRYWTI